jgi:hypothetical protein
MVSLWIAVPLLAAAFAAGIGAGAGSFALLRRYLP